MPLPSVTSGIMPRRGMFRQSEYANFLNTGISERKALRKRGEGFENDCYNLEGATAMRFSINLRHQVVIVWTLISIVVSVAVALSLGFSLEFTPWQLSFVMFFALLLVMILPAYLLIALWDIMDED
jgi:ABC-type glycerol-3-phosphate transport system permease component